ncbi:MAG TPA: response regulator [Clostridia bacterium]|nr:response regulator [Clostridia bacterium]
MLKLLIVEDEKWEREGLMDFLDWKSLGLELAGAACDGFEGIDKARVLRPDIIITDIKMPGMDGLKMSQSIREFLPGVKIIILTGYDDFNLARAAINMDANAYILKPVEEEELMEALKRVMDEYLSSTKKREERKMLEVLLDESQVAVRRELLLALLKDRVSEDIVRQASDLGMLPSTGKFAVIAAGSCKSDAAASADSILKKPDISVDLGGADTALRSDLVKIGASFATAVCEDDRTYFIITVPNDMASEYLRHAAGIISDYYGKRGIPAAAGIGSLVDCVGELYLTGRHAAEALNYAVFWNEPGIVDYAGLASLQQENTAKTGEFLTRGNEFTKQLMNALMTGDSKKTGCLLEDLFGLIEGNKWLDRNMVVNFLNGLLNETSLLFLTANLQYREEGAAGVLLPGLPDYGAIRERVCDFFRKLSETTRVNNKDQYMGGI